jgi:hypothetical protein
MHGAKIKIKKIKLENNQNGILSAETNSSLSIKL